MSCRRVPSLLFAAVAATAVIVPLAMTVGHHAPATPPSATIPLIVERPLTGIGGGETIRELHQDTPFAMVALTADDLSGTSTRVRAKKPDGSWGPWYEAENLEGVGPEAAAVRGTDPVYVGRTTDVQIAVRRPSTAAATSPKPGLGYLPAAVERPLGQDLKAVLISPPQAPVDISSLPPEAATPPGVPPVVIGRAQWGADESQVCGRPVYDEGVRAGIVHHTAGSNDYAPEDSAGIVRSIFEYHTRTLGWCDIAYNALVDKYGQVFEGRAGGMDRPVEGAHTGGFNLDTWGVAMLGNFDDVPPTPIQLRTTGRLLGWRLGLDHVDPMGTVAPDLGRRLLHEDPGGHHDHPADDLHPPRRRQHRLPRQCRLRGHAPPAGHRPLTSTRPSDATGPGRYAARRRHLPQMGLDGRRHQPPRRTANPRDDPEPARLATWRSPTARCTGRPTAAPNP